MAENKKPTPDKPGIAYEQQREALTIVRDVFGGTLPMRKKRTTYLPKFPVETDSGYNSRLASATLYNALKRTVNGLVGMVFRKDPRLSDDIPDEIKQDLENVDLGGRSVEVFLKDTFGDELLDGHTCIFVDMQRVDRSAVRTLADERDLELRPYWVPLLKSQILRWKTAKIRGREMLVEFAYKSSSIEPDGEWDEKVVERVRIYRLVGVLENGASEPRHMVQFIVWRKQESKAGREDEWVIEGTPDIMSIDEIPLVTAYANRAGFMVSNPPLLDLALENILHFQLRSDRYNTLHIAGVPIPVFIGLDEDSKIGVGVDLGIRLPVGGDAKYLEPTGAALTHSRDELKDIETRMAALGLAMLQRDTRAAETAEARRIEKAETDSALSSAAQGLEDAANECLRLHAKWRGMDAGGSIELNDDYNDQLLDPAMVAQLREMVATDDLSLDTLWEMMVRGEILPDYFDPDEERVRIEKQQKRRMAVAAVGAEDDDTTEEEDEDE